MSKKKVSALSASQLEIMNIVWDRGEVTVGEVYEILSAQRGIARNTVQTTMVRMEEKGWLKHRKVANAFRYTSTVARQKTLGRMIGDLVDRAFEGSVEGLVMTLLEQRGLSKAEANRIRTMIDKSKKNRK